LANTQAYVLDRALRPVPVGVLGELCLGGVQLARGYLHRPERTASSFLPNPFTEKPGQRIYRTGDLVRYLPDGNIQFLGRIDHQVKMHGLRIELGEIESVLAQHPAAREPVVLLREDRPGLKRLVAYLVASRDEALAVRDLRAYAAERLPDFMVPAAFVIRDHWPLTPSGKLNRRALPPPDQKDFTASTAFVAPRDAMEESVAEIWKELLGLDAIGVHDSFFDLGGHSLLATQATSRLRACYDVALPLRLIFETPTVASLAGRLKLLCWASGSAQDVAVVPGEEIGEI
jgi:hypothetical protein